MILLRDSDDVVDFPENCSEILKRVFCPEEFGPNENLMVFHPVWVISAFPLFSRLIIGNDKNMLVTPKRLHFRPLVCYLTRGAYMHVSVND